MCYRPITVQNTSCLSILFSPCGYFGQAVLSTYLTMFIVIVLLVVWVEINGCCCCCCCWSSASQACLTHGVLVLKLRIMIHVLTEYLGMTKGSPCVVPSCDNNSPPKEPRWASIGVNDVKWLFFAGYLGVRRRICLLICHSSVHSSVHLSISSLKHSMYRGLWACAMASAKLKRARCLLNLFRRDSSYSFSNYLPHQRQQVEFQGFYTRGWVCKRYSLPAKMSDLWIRQSPLSNPCPLLWNF